MTLRERQEIFARNVALLIQHINGAGYTCTLGEAWRPPEMMEIYANDGRGIRNSLHGRRLALDINLFKTGEYLPDSESHRIFGDWWKLQHPENRWGGDSKRKDGNHYEMNPDGE
jgi:hypothetical protein